MEFKRIKTNCNYFKIGGKIFLFSYDSVIGIIINEVLYLSEPFLKRSRTTSKHINLFRNEFNPINEIILNENTFKNLTE